MDDLDEMSQQEAESEIELYYAVLDAIQSAKNIGLSEDHVKTLCYVAGVEISLLD